MRRWSPRRCTLMGPRTPARGSRNVCFGPQTGWVEIPVIAGSDLAGGVGGSAHPRGARRDLPRAARRPRFPRRLQQHRPRPLSPPTVSHSGLRPRFRPLQWLALADGVCRSSMITDWSLGRTIWCRGRCCLYSLIRIVGYRSLGGFKLDGLGRVNLLVGTNNCGKTSILECIELLHSAGNPYVLSSILRPPR